MDQISCLCMSPVLFQPLDFISSLFWPPRGCLILAPFEFAARWIPPPISTLLTLRIFAVLWPLNQYLRGLYKGYEVSFKGLHAKRGEMSSKTGEIGIKPTRALQSATLLSMTSQMRNFNFRNSSRKKFRQINGIKTKMKWILFLAVASSRVFHKPCFWSKTESKAVFRSAGIRDFVESEPRRCQSNGHDGGGVSGFRLLFCW